MSQFSAISTAEWLDGLPFLGAALTRNFLDAAAVSDRLFSLFVFVHIGLALLLVFALLEFAPRFGNLSFGPRWLPLGGVTAAAQA